MLDAEAVPTGDLNATFCAVLVDEWIRAGVTDVVISPGSRSTPVALAVADRSELTVHVHHDERSAGFIGLGIGLRTGFPAVVVTTSGTAAVELHPAVVEAHQAAVPLLVVTADRPPELRDVGAPQTIDQDRLFGTAVRWFVDPAPPVVEAAGSWRSLGSRMVAETVCGSAGPGPVHANLPFREPLVGTARDLSAGRPDGRPWHLVLTPWLPADTVGSIDEGVVGWFGGKQPERPVLVVGAGCGDVEIIAAFADATGWPIIADSRSGLRTGHPSVVTTADAILRSEGVAEAMTPDLVVRLGEPPASKVVAGWMASGASNVVVEPTGRWSDSARTADLLVRAVPSDLVHDLAAVVESPADGLWTQRWRDLEARASSAVSDHLAAVGTSSVTDAGVARRVVGDLCKRSVAGVPTSLVVSSSMPIRDVEWFGGSAGQTRVLANRGANGIDGVVSTAVGVALSSRGETGARTVALVGDIAFLHDTNALLGLTSREVDLTILVVDNCGGGIFSFLPQAQVLERDRFEQLFGTPHDVDLVALADAHGIRATAVDAGSGMATFAEVLASAVDGGGVEVVIARTDRAANVAAHEAIHAAVRAAISDLFADGDGS